MDQLKHSHNSGKRGEGKNRYNNSHASLSLPSLIETSFTSASSADGSIPATIIVDDASNDSFMGVSSRVENRKTTETKQDCRKSQFSASSKGIPRCQELPSAVIRRSDNREQLERLVGKVSIISLSSQDKLSETLALAERLDAMCSSINESYARETSLEHNNDSNMHEKVHRSREAEINQDGAHVPPGCTNKSDQATSSREINYEDVARRYRRNRKNTNLSRGETNVLYRKQMMDSKQQQQQHGEQDQNYPPQSENAADYFDFAYMRRSRQAEEPLGNHQKEGYILHRDSRSRKSEPVIRKQMMDSNQQQHRKRDQKYLSQSESAADCFDRSYRGRSRPAEEPLGRHVKEIHTHHHDSQSWKSEPVMSRRPYPTSIPLIHQNYGAKWRKSGQQFNLEGGGGYHDRLGSKSDCSKSGYPRRQQNTFPRNDGMSPSPATAIHRSSNSSSGMRHANGKYQPMRPSISDKDVNSNHRRRKPGRRQQ